MKLKIFLSYSWDNQEHKNWVRQLADRLIQNGIEVILDQYDLRGGEDMHKFMESAVNSATHILVICTPDYVKRANERVKGAGEETSLITSDFYTSYLSGKCYLPIVRKSEGLKNVPDYLGSLVYFDFTDDSSFDPTLQELLRNIYQEPELIKPQLGVKPNFQSSIPAQNLQSVNNLSVSGIKNRVLDSNVNDWIYDDEIGIYTNNSDVRLQIRQKRTDRLDSFHEEWTDRFPDPKAHRDFYEIYYDNNRVCDYFQVSVDGCRVSIPIPKLGKNLTITQEQYTFGKLIHNSGNNRLYDFDDYMRRSGITIEAT